MKYCPFCGADLIEGAVSFCAECGKELPPAKTEAKQSESGKKQASKKNFDVQSMYDKLSQGQKKTVYDFIDYLLNYKR